MSISDLTASTWTAGPALPVGRFSLVAVNIDGRLFLFGGQTSTGDAAETLELKQDLTTWEIRPKLATPPHGGGNLVSIVYNV